MSTFTAFETTDIRFPTSSMLDGSDAMNLDPDYSAAYLQISTDAGDGLEGHGFVFTIGRGNDVQVAAIDILRDRIIGHDVEETLESMGRTWRRLVHDSQLRWLGPEKGVMHMAIGAVINALWDLKAKRAGVPLWRLLALMRPAEIVELVDFRYLTDALTPQEALRMLEHAEPTRQSRLVELQDNGYPGYATSPGWLGYSDDKMVRLATDAVAEGFTQLKLKVGGDVEDDVRRLRLARAAVGEDVRIAVDANQRWDVPDAIAWVARLAEFDIAWVEEPTNPDDVLGHAAISRAIAPIPVATGEHAANRVMVKQFLQADAVQVLQLDATRVAGINENVAILLLAAKFGVRVCPHAGGVGLCEMVQHLAMFDFVSVSATMQDRTIEYVDHLHEHFESPAEVRKGRYWPPSAPGTGAEIRITSRVTFTVREPIRGTSLGATNGPDT